MKHKVLFGLAAVGIAAGIVAAYLSSRRPPAQQPLFQPATNPFANGVYANGIIESAQSHGQNINIFPEITGPITSILVAEGDRVREGDTLLTIDAAVQQATAEQYKAQAEAAAAVLAQLKAQPRAETLAISRAQVVSAQATLKNAEDILAKREAANVRAPGSVTQDELDTDRNAVAIAQANLVVAEKQLALVEAGAWIYDIENQERQVAALTKQWESAAEVVKQYTLRAPSDGLVMAVQSEVGSYVSPQGAYDSYTGAMLPLVVMSGAQEQLQVRCYIDEILIHRLPALGTAGVGATMRAEMQIRGTEIRIPLTFVRVQPYVTPKIELSNQRREQVDVRVLPVIVRFEKPRDLSLYPGQLVDVYIGTP